MNAMALAGTWIVTQNKITGQIYTRHGVTTADYSDLNFREEQITRNVDSISFQFNDALSLFIGVTNITDSTQAAVGVAVKDQAEVIKSNVTERLGSQITFFELLSIAPSITLLDQLNVDVDIEVPKALNRLRLRLVI